MKQLKVYLADLRHVNKGISSSDAMPTGVAYMKAVIDTSLSNVDSEVFAYPSNLEAAIKSHVPDVLFLTNYMWNEQLSLHFASWVKSLHPESLIVMGGPNFPCEEERQVQYFQSLDNIDLYCCGEGDFYAAEIVEMFMQAELNIERLLSQDIHSSIYSRNGTIVTTPIKPRSKDLDEIPSPWLSGIMDKFFNGKLAPLIETNRGCPFSCTFCVQGGRWYTKVNYFSLERLKEEIHYIGRMITEKCPEQKVLRVADPNFGMFKRDVDVASYWAETQVKYNYPLYIDATTGKNQAENIIKSIEKVNGALVMYQAVQSLDEDVLNNIKRKNIKLDTYDEIQVYIRGRGLRSSSDLILGLPGETLDTHVTALKKLVNSGTNNLNNHASLLLKGSELETIAERKKNEFTTHFRLVPKTFGEYIGKRVFEIDEVVTSTKTMDFDEYLTARKYHFVLSVFWNESRFDRIVEYLMQLGLERWDFIEAVFEEVQLEEGVFKPILEDFIQETRSELFDSPEDAIDYYSRDENFRRVQNSEIGDNLMYKYRAMGSFWYWDAVCVTVFNAIQRLIEEHDPALHASHDWLRFMKDWKQYFLHVHSYGKNTEEVLMDKSCVLNFNIPAWNGHAGDIDFERYKLEAPTKVMFALSDEQKSHLRGAFKIWEYELPSLPMIVKRIHNSWQLRLPVISRHAEATTI